MSNHSHPIVTGLTTAAIIAACRWIAKEVSKELAAASQAPPVAESENGS